MILSVVVFFTMGLNFGIDFRGGTTIRTESTQAVDVGEYRDALQTLGLGDVTITQVFDPTFAADQHVAMIRIEAQEGDESVASKPCWRLRVLCKLWTQASHSVRGKRWSKGIRRAD